MSRIPVCKRCDEKGIWLKVDGSMEFDATSEIIKIRFGGWFCPKCMAFLDVPRKRPSPRTIVTYRMKVSKREIAKLNE